MRIETNKRDLAAFYMCKMPLVEYLADDELKEVTFVFEGDKDLETKYYSNHFDTMVFAQDYSNAVRHLNQIVWKVRNERTWDGKWKR